MNSNQLEERKKLLLNMGWVETESGSFRKNNFGTIPKETVEFPSEYFWNILIEFLSQNAKANKNYLLPAYPLEIHEGCVNNSGATLLDYIATRAMEGFLSNPVESTKLDAMKLPNAEIYQLIAIAAYQQADAMLIVRKRYIPDSTY